MGKEASNLEDMGRVPVVNGRYFPSHQGRMNTWNMVRVEEIDGETVRYRTGHNLIARNKAQFCRMFSPVPEMR